MTTPIDLRAAYGHRYKITMDEAAKFDPAGKNDPWLFQIPCRYGHIYPHSDKLLAYYCCGKKIRAHLHREHPELEVPQWTDDYEAVFLFPLELFETIAEYAKPKIRRRLSERRRKRLIEAGRAHQFCLELRGPQSSLDDRRTHFSEEVAP